MHMAMWSRYAAHRDPRHDLNLSSFVEMDIETAHDTANTMGIRYGAHQQMNTVRMFSHASDRKNRDLQIETVLADKK